MKKVDWLCCQFGAREYYAVPRSLIKNGVNTGLITDIWLDPSSLLGFLVPGNINRYHPDIEDAAVKSFNGLFLMKHLAGRIKVHKDNSLDRLFEQKTADWIRRNIDKMSPKVVFSYSYSSLEIFREARRSGITTICGQINPGPLQSEVVKEAFYNEFADRHQPTNPDSAYWNRWCEEADLANYIVVNSMYSGNLIHEAGIPKEKIRIIPLAFERTLNSGSLRVYPEQFSRERPLRLLYLGRISVLKGFHLLKKAMKALLAEPVILDLAGNPFGPDELMWNLPPNIVYHGRKDGEEKDRLFRNADVFILPTLSDGFAITQLEAQYWKLPMIATNRCGEVVRNGHNGIILDHITPDTIKEAVQSILDQPGLLGEYSRNAVDLNDYSLKTIGRKWMALVGQNDQN